MNYSLIEINNILNKVNWNSSGEKNLVFQGVSIDSRSVNENDLFIAIEGNNFDGHNFIDQVISKGVKAFVIKNGMQNLIPENYPYWSVPDTLEAFQEIALYKRKRLNLKVIGVTGSVGKTTTKEMIGEILRKFVKVKISTENNNNEIGMGLTIFSAEKKDKLLVLEMGMRGKGQIKNLSKYSLPDIAVITNVGTSHIGLLGSRENIAKAKTEIVDYLNPKGVIIIPYNEPLIDENLKKKWKGRIVRVSLINKNQKDKINFVDQDVIVGFLDNESKKIFIEDKSFQISFKGKHNFMNFLFAYAVAKELGIEFSEFNKFSFNNLLGRNRIIQSDKVKILDETYNASPESIRACVEVLLECPGKHFLILGSIKELGKESTHRHLEVLNYLCKINIEFCCFLVNKEEEEAIKKEFTLNKKIIFFNDANNIPEFINHKTNSGDSVLVKGSRYWELEKIIPLIH